MNAHTTFTAAVLGLACVFGAGSSALRADEAREGKINGTARPTSAAPRAGVSPTALERGEEVRSNVELWEERVNRKLRSLDDQLKDLDLAKIKSQKLARDEFESILLDLDEEAAAILDAYASVATDMKLYRKALEQAPPAFREISAEFEKLAETAEEPFFRESYADLASVSTRLAASYAKKSESLDALEKELKGKLVFVGQSRQFVGQVRKFLRTVPADHGVDTERWIARVNTYVEILQQAVKALKSMADQMDHATKEKPASASSRSPAAGMPTALKPASASPATTLPQGRLRFATLRQ